MFGFVGSDVFWVFSGGDVFWVCCLGFWELFGDSCPPLLLRCLAGDGWICRLCYVHLARDLRLLAGDADTPSSSSFNGFRLVLFGCDASLVKDFAWWLRFVRL